MTSMHLLFLYAKLLYGQPGKMDLAIGRLQYILLLSIYQNTPAQIQMITRMIAITTRIHKALPFF